MAAQSPEELDKLFAEALNSANLEEILSLYESEAALVPEPGKTVSGSDALKESISQFLAMTPQIEMNTQEMFRAGDVALVFADYTLTGTAPDGNPFSQPGRSIAVVRRQSDGAWKYAIDCPFPPA